MSRRRQLLGLCLSVVLLAGLLFVVDSGQFFSVLSRVHFQTYSVAMVMFLGTYLMIALRWQILVSETDVELAFRESLEIVMLSYGINKLLPANAGDLARSKITDQYTSIDSHSELLGTVIVERLADLCTICAFVSVGVPMLFDSSFRSVAVVAVIAMAVMMSVVVFNLATYVPAVPFLPARIQSALERALAAIDSVTRKQIWLVFGVSVLRWLVLAGVFVLLGLSVSLSLPFLTAAFVVAVMSLFGVLPLSPGGLGPVDAAGTGALTLAGFTSAEAFSLVVLQRSLGLGLMALVGYALYNYRLWIPPDPS